MKKITLCALTLLLLNSCSNAKKESIAAGEAVYKTNCASCHQPDGSGAPPMNPSLVKTSFVLGSKDSLVHIILKGMNNRPVDGQMFHNAMPPLDFLTDKEIADVLTFVRNNFGNEGDAVTEPEVRAARTTTR